MSRIRSKDTTPERAVRSMLHAMGYRFRLHRKDLPGKPDITLPKYRTAVFVHGCYWHRHPGCRYATTPKTRTDWWLAKFARNVERDAEAQAALVALGWRVVVVWECELRDAEALAERLDRALKGKGAGLTYAEPPGGTVAEAAEQAGTWADGEHGHTD